MHFIGGSFLNEGSPESVRRKGGAAVTADNILVSALINTGIIIAGILLLGLLAECLQQLIVQAIVFLSNPRTAKLIVNRITFVGVVHHELSHALLAFLTGAKITKISLFKPDKKSGPLGSVSFLPRGFGIMQAVQRTLASIAPVPCGMTTSWLIYSLALPECSEIWHYAIVIYILVSILVHMNLSPADIKAAAKGAPYICLIIFVIVLLTGFDLRDDVRGLYERFWVSA